MQRMLDIEMGKLRPRGDSKLSEESKEKAVEQKEVLKTLLDIFLEANEEEQNLNNDDHAPRMSQALIEQVESFLRQLSLCYQSYGCPTHTLEVTMKKVGKGLGVDVQFIVFPSHTIFEISDVQTDRGMYRKHSEFFRTSSGFNFYKLQLVDELARRISSYAIDVDPIAAQANVGLGETVIDEAFERARAYSEEIASQPVVAADQLSDPPCSGNFADSTDTVPGIAIGSDTSPNNIDTTHSEYAAVPTLEDIEEGMRRNSMKLSDQPKSTLPPPPPPPQPVQIDELPEIKHELPKEPYYNLLPKMRQRHAEKTLRYGKSSKLHGLGKMILDLARLGPNVYAVAGEKRTRNAKYRNLFSKLAVEDGIGLIRAIMKQKPLYSDWFKSVLLGIASFGCCGLFFGGGWTDMWVSLLLGFLVARIEFISAYAPSFSRVYEFFATFVVSIIVRAVIQGITTLCYRAVVMSSIVFSLQGVTITLSFIDLMTKDLISGTTRLFYGLLISAMIGFAMDVSTSTYAALAQRTYDEVLADSDCGPERGVNPNWYPLLLIITTVSFNLLVEAHKNQLLQMELISIASYAVYYFTSDEVSSQLPTILAAFTAACLANLYCRFTGHPAIVYIIPTVFLLVPGSVAASSFYTVLTLDLQGGMNLAFSVVTGALAIAIGLFGASAVVQVPEVEDIFERMKAIYPGPKSVHLEKRKSHKNSALTL